MAVPFERRERYFRSLLKSMSTSKPELGDKAPIPFDVPTAQIIEKSAPLPDHHQQAPPAVVVMFVISEVLGEVVDLVGEQRHLDLG